MISLNVIFWMFILIFALVGSMRSWSKELLVLFSVILALFIIQVIQIYVAPVSKLLSSGNPTGQFCLWSLLIITFAMFGYHVPAVHKLAGIKLNGPRDRLQDWLLGAIIGACNGYMIVGTIWAYLHMAGYPFSETHMIAPKPGTPAGDAALKLITWLPPAWLGVPHIYFAVAVSFAIIVIVFI
jgi:hypothetical protein